MDVIAIVRLALNLLNERLLTITALLLVFVLSCWTMYLPGVYRLSTLALFAVFSLILLRKRVQDEKSKGLAEQE